LEDVPTLVDWPVDRPRNWIQRVNQAESQEELATMRRCVNRGRPLGPADWVQRMADQLDLGMLC